MSLAAPSSHHPSRRWRDSRSISWTSRSVDQVRCLTQHVLNNGLLGNPDYPRDISPTTKQTQREEEQEFDFLLDFFLFNSS